MRCFLCKSAVMAAVRDDKGREFCGYGHLGDQAILDAKDMQAWTLRRTEELARQGGFDFTGLYDTMK